MTILGQLERALGLGKYKIDAGYSDVTMSSSGGSISTGLSTVKAFIAIVEENTAGVAYMVKIDSISGGTVTIRVFSYDGTTFSEVTSGTVKVHWFAIGS